ncbi:GTP binding protein, partial [Diplocarpon rosae]
TRNLKLAPTYATPPSSMSCQGIKSALIPVAQQSVTLLTSHLAKKESTSTTSHCSEILIEMSDTYVNSEASADGPRRAPADPLAAANLKILNQNPTSEVLGTHSLNLRLSAEKARCISKSILEILKLEEEPRNEDQKTEDHDDEEEVIDLENQQQRTERLKEALPVMAQLWWADSDQINLVAEKLADGSRDPKWRIPLGDSGILNFFLEIFGVSGNVLRHDLKIHVLRLIGNCCADTDENRSRVVASNHMRSIVLQLQDVSLIAFAIPVLYNICIDYEPSQRQASESLLTKELVELISSPRFNNSRQFLGYMCKMLDLMAAQASDPELAPESTPIVLLKLAADQELPVDMDDFMALVNTAIAYLKYERYQKALISRGALDGTLAVLVDSYRRFDSHSSKPKLGAAKSSDQDGAKALSQMRTNFIQVLSDVSALSDFQETCPVTSPFSSSLQRWLSSPHLQLQVCSCIMLGNIARSDTACEMFVHVSQVHKLLISILVDATDSQLLHATIGFLKNLAMPAKNKELLGDADLFDVLPRLWTLDVLQPVQFSAISLARQLTVGNFNNVRRICKRLSEDEETPYTHTKLSLLIALFERTDVEPIKMEIARLVTSICRVLSTGVGRDTTEAEMSRWPVVRSEGWLVFALLARTPEGAQCVSDLTQDVTVFRLLVEMLTGKPVVDSTPSSSSPSSSISPCSPPSTPPVPSIHPELEAHTSESVQPHAKDNEIVRLDRENALVLINELLKNRGAQMEVMRRTQFEDLLRGGTQLVQSYREASPDWKRTNIGPMAPDQRVMTGLDP